ncbi:thiamine pyrophosphate-dependent enzyme [Bacillus sp. V2I10]|uniref:thiamine pyrophosphate-dependent enzyme n=1 Tax=Bacillus sp. V2I10 TaxID=3042276 RepID=UPI0027D8419D|nr:thiamine pyrophosphate-dependent enzyme [Bacillus sp. V2I10]
MNSQELETANRIGLVFIVTIFNDKRYSLIEKHQRNANFEVTQVTFSNPDFELYARSFGIGYRRASNVDSFQLAVREAIDSSELNLLEVVLEEKDI